jgi:two-component system sensor histidine kinase EvgS
LSEQLYYAGNIRHCLGSHSYGGLEHMSDSQIIALVVDDSEVVRTFVTRALEGAGCMVFTATNGQEAVSLASKGFAQLVMMDLYMPLMDGWTAAKEIRRQEAQRGKRRCFMVAMSAAPNKEQCVESGMDDVVEKPLTLELVREIVERTRQAEECAAVASVVELAAESQ